MALSKKIIAQLVELSLDGEYHHHSIDQFCKTYPELTEAEAYEGQALRVQRMEEMGHRVVGYKLGGTSLAKQKQMASTIYDKGGLTVKPTGITYGRLMDYMLLAPDEDLSLSQLLHPKVEPEMAFIMGQDLSGPYVTAPDVMNAAEWVAPAFEIIDSRWLSWSGACGKRAARALKRGTSSSLAPSLPPPQSRWATPCAPTSAVWDMSRFKLRNRKEEHPLWRLSCIVMTC